LSDSEDRFESLRLSFVDRVEAVRDAGSENELASLLDEIGEEAARDLEQVVGTGDGGYELVVAVEAWASLASYATTRFYFEGPESIRRLGGFSKDVVSSLQRHAQTYSAYLRRALQATHATSFSIAVGFPFGLSLGLAWDPGAQAEREARAAREVDERAEKIEREQAALDRLKKQIKGGRGMF
jgi:hypothetical protein